MRPPSTGSDQVDTPWVVSYPAGVPSTYRYPSVPAPRLLDDAAQDFPETVAVEYRGYRLSYRKLLDHTDRFATALAARGVGPGDRIAVALPNCPHLVITLFAAWRLGAGVVLSDGSTERSAAGPAPTVIVTTDRILTRDDAPLSTGTDVIVSRRADYLPFPRNVLAHLRGTLRGRGARTPGTGGVLRFADLVRRSPPAPDDVSQRVDLPAIAGEATDISQQHLVINSFQLRLWLADVVAGDERVLLSIPLTSTTGVVWLLTSVLSAATMILVDNGRAARRQRTAFRARPTILPLRSAVVDDLLRSSWRIGHLDSVRFAVSTDALDDDAVAHLEDLTDKGRVRHAWGVNGVLTHADPIYGRVVPGSVGLPLPDTVAVITDSHGNQRAPGVRGRLWLRGPQLCGDGWVDGRVDATLGHDGYLFVHGPAGPHRAVRDAGLPAPDD